jgi:hypothetical protein
MKKSIPNLLTLFFTVFLFKAAGAQHDFRPGYIVTYGNDTTQGQIDYAPVKINSVMCNFRPDSTAPVQIYSAADIKEYSFISGKRCVTKNIQIGNKPALYFLECLVSGEVSLFYLKNSGVDHYFLEQTGNIVELKKGFQTYVENGVTYSRTSEKYKSLLLAVLKDAPAISKEIEHTYFDRKSLTALIVTYHQRINKPTGYVVYTTDENKPRRKKYKPG